MTVESGDSLYAISRRTGVSVSELKRINNIEDVRRLRPGMRLALGATGDLDGGGTIQGLIAAVEQGLELADAETKIIAGHGPLSDRAGLQEYHGMLAQARDRVQALVDQGMSLEQVVQAKPTAEWDELLGGVWITPAQFVTFIYNSLTGVERFTALESQDTDTE